VPDAGPPGGGGVDKKTADRCRFDQPLRGKRDEVRFVPHSNGMQILCQPFRILSVKSISIIFSKHIS
jgi:hypothetical protein